MQGTALLLAMWNLEKAEGGFDERAEQVNVETIANKQRPLVLKLHWTFQALGLFTGLCNMTANFCALQWEIFGAFWYLYMPFVLICWLVAFFTDPRKQGTTIEYFLFLLFLVRTGR